MAAVVLIVVILLVGGLGYAALNAVKPGSGTVSSCQPAISTTCVSILPTHDVQLFVPFAPSVSGSPVIQISQGGAIPVTVSLKNGELASSFTINWGDGSTPTTQAGVQATHTYSTLGEYIISATAQVGSVTHDSSQSLVVVQVIPGPSVASTGTTPSVTGSVVSNGTATTGTPYAIASGTATMTFTGSYTAEPTNPAFSYISPKVVISSGLAFASGSPTNTSSSATATVTAAAPGVDWVTFVGEAQQTSGGSAVAFENYTWTIFVAPAGVSPGFSIIGSHVNSGPSKHPGSIVTYELAPGGGSTEDPATDYETVGYEPILNVYQTLISYNASLTGPTYQNYVPTLATCVPGSPQCQALYGQSLISGGGEYYTFVIDKAARFYDPGTKASWPVFPSDVMFSITRTCAWADQPYLEKTAGWILCQALLPANGTGVNGPLNNLPGYIFNSMYVNSSAYCPAVAITQANGCITFNAWGGWASATLAPHLWPYFLELVADNLGASVVPCGWFSEPAQGAFIPDWTQGVAANQGDHPCTLLGGATTTDASAYKTALQTINNTGGAAWASYEAEDNAWPATNPGVQWTMVGSGPYYMYNYAIGVSYTLKANPAYVQPTYCTWTNCEPAVGAFAPLVSVTWETTQTPGEEAYASGAADFASIPSTDVGTLLSLVQKGNIGALPASSISIFFMAFNMNFNFPGAVSLDPNPINVPTTFMSHIGLRQFMVNTWPYTTIQNTIATKDGIQYFINYGGAIPHFMGAYYPQNISWPSTDPCVGSSCASASSATAPSPTYWWNQVANVTTSPYYSATVAACKSTPCTFPLFGQTGAPDLDERLALWISNIEHLSGGALVPTQIDLNFVQLVNGLGGPGATFFPIFNLGWAPDFPDPNDYVPTMLAPDNAYTAPDSVFETLSPFNSSSCSTSPTAYSSAASVVSEACQGAAFNAMNSAFYAAAILSAGPQRVLLYNIGEHIANQLALYVWWGQQTGVFTYASWVNPNSVNSNVTIGGGGDQTWYLVTGNGVA